jgi:hypothetical protein
VPNSWHGLCSYKVETKVQIKTSLKRSEKQELAMTALRKIRIEEEPAANTVVRAPAPKLYVVTNNAPVEAPQAAGGTLKNVALFLAAPFIGLAYIVALPLVGLVVMAVLVGRAAAKFNAIRKAALVLKHVGLVVAAPFIGLAYVVFFPFIALGALVWVAGKAVAVRN